MHGLAVDEDLTGRGPVVTREQGEELVLSLSLEGAEFLPFAREILDQETAALAALGQSNDTVTGTLRFACSSSYAQLYIMPILPEFMARHPGITLDLRLTDMQYDLLEGSFDLALRSTVLSDSSLKARKLADDARILCASPDYLARHGTPVHPEDLYQHRYIAFRQRGRHVLTNREGGHFSFEPTAEQTHLMIDDGTSQRLAAVAGAGIAITALWGARQHFENGELEHVLPDYVVDQETGLWLVYPKTNVLSPKVRVFIDFLIEILG